MTATASIIIVVDRDGRVVGAQLPRDTHPPKGEFPKAQIAVRDGQRAVPVEVPREILELRGADLHAYLSDIKIAWPAEVRLPKVRIEKAPPPKRD